MQRPTRIMVFGILCLAMGVILGLNSLSELSTAVIGPDALPAAATATDSGSGVGQMMGESARVARLALEKPGYRVTLGIKGAAGVLMSGLLIAAGAGLLRDQLWSVRLARVWAWYALVAGVVNVVLQARYVLPEMSPEIAGAQGVGAVMLMACMLPILWAFPVCVLTLLGRPVVMDYLRWRCGQGGRGVQARSGTAQEDAANRGAADQPRPSAPGQNAASDPSSQPSQPPRPAPRPGGADQATRASQTWRDDPWNDANSQ